MLDAVDHLVQVGHRFLYVVVLVLSRPAFRRENCTPMDLFEVAVGKSVSLCGVLVLLIIDSKMPLRVSLESVSLYELILFLGRRSMFAPGISFVFDNSSFVDKFFRRSKRHLI